MTHRLATLGATLLLLSACSPRFAEECGSTRCQLGQVCCTLCGGHQVCADECPTITSCYDAGTDADVGHEDGGLPPVVDAGAPSLLDPEPPLDAGVDAGPPERDAGIDGGSGACDAPETCDGTDEDCDGAIDEGAGCPCPVVQGDGGAYLFCDSTRRWTAARDACDALGYQLVVIEDATEDAFVYATLADHGFADTWIGLSDRAVEDRWVWVTDVPMGYVNWDSGEPNDGGTSGEDCGIIMTSPSRRASKWDDRDCGSTRPYVCEAPAFRG